MKNLFLGLFLFLASCASMEKGNYRVKYNGVEHKATAISITDEDEKIKYKDEAGKVQTFKGSFEVYQD
jgi:hypothetical protein